MFAALIYSTLISFSFLTFASQVHKTVQSRLILIGVFNDYNQI